MRSPAWATVALMLASSAVAGWLGSRGREASCSTSRGVGPVRTAGWLEDRSVPPLQPKEHHDYANTRANFRPGRGSH